MKAKSHRLTPKSTQFTLTQHLVTWNRGKTLWVGDKYSFIAQFPFLILLIVLRWQLVSLFLCSFHLNWLPRSVHTDMTRGGQSFPLLWLLTKEARCAWEQLNYYLFQCTIKCHHHVTAEIHMLTPDLESTKSNEGHSRTTQLNACHLNTHEEN